MITLNSIFRQYSNADILIICIACILVVVALYKIDTLNRPIENDKLTGRSRAKYPKLNKKLLFKNPTGIIFGKWKNRYVCKPNDVDGHCFIIGGSGSGKSSCLVIPTLLANPDIAKFVLDIKGELSFKSVKYGSENIAIFNPQDRSTYGYNPFFLLNKDSTNQTILETMQLVAFSLIQLNAHEKDPFWKVSARNLLIGLLIYYYKQGVTDFVSIVDEILGKPIEENIQAVMENSKPNSNEYHYIVQFSNMAKETLYSVVGNINNHLVIFANDNDIRFAFKDNPLKMNPHMLEDGYSIYLSIREEKLSAYYDVLQLIINQTLAELEKRPEDSHNILFCIDELPRILSAGKLEHLLDGIKTLRSRRVTLFLITQSLEALMNAYSENEVADIISNCPYIVVLSASSVKTLKLLTELCGKYRAKKRQWNGDGKKQKISITFEDKPIVKPDELMTLQNTGEAILISPYGYSRIKKTPYYKGKAFKDKANEIIKYNQTISNM